jgi:hypothetical protein
MSPRVKGARSGCQLAMACGVDAGALDRRSRTEDRKRQGNRGFVARGMNRCETIERQRGARAETSPRRERYSHSGGGHPALTSRVYIGSSGVARDIGRRVERSVITAVQPERSTRHR